MSSVENKIELGKKSLSNLYRLKNLESAIFRAPSQGKWKKVLSLTFLLNPADHKDMKERPKHRLKEKYLILW